MVRPNYRDFRRSQFILTSGQHLEHSAKGSTWEDHKYIKKVDGTYYYPESYEGGRHLSDNKEKEKDNNEEFDSSKAATEFNKFLKSLSDTGQAYFGSKEEWENMTLDDFKDLYEDILGRDPTKELSENAIKDMFDNVKKQNVERDADNKSAEDIEKMAQDVVKGKYGVGSERKKLLGENYSEVQKRVNELMKGSVGKKKVSKSSSPSAIEKAVNAASKVGKSAKRR